jgi:hypothetical protein
MKRDGEPPFLLDGARIVQYATVPQRPNGRSGVVVNGVGLDPQSVSHIAIVQMLLDETYFVLHCNERWETVAAEPFSELAVAEAACANAYGADVVPWQPYRELTAEESREIESTREFLRELMAGEFNQ